MARNPFQTQTAPTTQSSMPWWAQDFGTGDPQGYGLDLHDQNMYETMLKKSALGMWPAVAQQVQSGVDLAPWQTAAQRSMATALNPSNVQGLIDAFNRQTDQNAAQQSSLAGLMARNSGLGSGAVEGAQLDALNRAAAQKNSYLGQLLSPTGIQQTYAAYLNALNQATQSPLLTNLANLIHSSPAHVQSTDGWSSLLGGIAAIPGASDWVSGALFGA